MAADRGYGWLDLGKLAAALLVIANHTGPLSDWGDEADYILTGIVSRIAVPFFFMASGFFFFRSLKAGQSNTPQLRKFMTRIGGLYVISMLMYLPVNLYAGHISQMSTVGDLFREIVFDGTFYHLWYLPALMLGTAIVYVLRLRLRLSNQSLLLVTGILYIIGMFGDSYYGISKQVHALSSCYELLFDAMGQTRNGLFFAPLFLAIGAAAGNAAAEQTSRRSLRRYGWLLMISFAMLLTEGIVLHRLELQLHEVMYVALIPTVYALFRLLISRRSGSYRTIRQMSTTTYIIHPLVIVFVRGISDFLDLREAVVGNSWMFFIVVTLLTLLFAAALAILRLPTTPTSGKSRAWVEIDLNHLDHNARALKLALPRKTSLMAVVKANAYGHGSIGIARRLNRLGVRHYAVAEIGEGIELRQAGVRGEILILGYTPTERLHELIRWKLTQTVVHAEDARRLQAHGGKFKVHVKLDTGMNRLGERSDHVEEILSMYRHSRLKVMGTYSQLAAADGTEPQDIAFSREQISRFRETVARIRAAGLQPGRVHLQNSYGILNYPELEMDLARPGIALYGLLSTEGEATRTSIDLRPVLSLKASVSRVHLVKAGESVSYGRTYTAAADTMIATVAIGYADGIPRELSEKGGSVLIRGRRAPIVGRVCMDQLTVDVSGIPNVRQGDAATIIGKDGAECITAGEIARRTGTITNEIVCAMGTRVPKQYKVEKAPAYYARRTLFHRAPLSNLLLRLRP